MTREEAIDIIKCLAWHTRPNEEDIEQAIKALEQEPKIGHRVYDDFFGSYYCSECNNYLRDSDNYCPGCGCHIVEPQESEDV